MTHDEIITEIQLAITQLGGRAWKTIPGVLYVGRVVSRRGNQIMLTDAYPYKLFPEGEPDLHFFFPAKTDGIKGLLFGKIEVKTKTYPKLTKKQRDNLKTFSEFGGAAYVARETESGIVLEMFKTGDMMLLEKSSEGRYSFEKI